MVIRKSLRTTTTAEPFISENRNIALILLTIATIMTAKKKQAITIKSIITKLKPS